MPIHGISTISSKTTYLWMQYFCVWNSYLGKKKIFVKNKYDSSIDKRCRVKKVFKTNSGRDDFLELWYSIRTFFTATMWKLLPTDYYPGTYKGIF